MQTFVSASIALDVQYISIIQRMNFKSICLWALNEKLHREKGKKFKQSEQKLHSFAAKKNERPCMCGYKAKGRERRVKCGKMHSNRIESNPIWESNYWILQHQTDCCVADYSGKILYDHILQFDYTFCECGFFLLWCKTNSIFQTKYSTLVAHFWVLADENN